MKTLTKETQRRLRRWLQCNARPLEWALYLQKFENGSVEAVLDALAAYQNPDGGFGYALEPDDWNQNSTLNATVYAMQRMMGIGVSHHPLMDGALRFLRSGACFQKEEWQFCTPSSREFPHAPWWGMSEEEAKEENPGVTNKVAGLLLELCQPEDSLYQTALRVAQRSFPVFMQLPPKGEREVEGYALLLPHWIRLGVAPDPEKAIRRMLEIGNAVIERDPSRWPDYVPRPSSVISTPESPLYPMNQEIVEQELDYLIDTLSTNGVWEPNWTWYNTIELYPEAYAISRNWWRSILAIGHLSFLRAFGRLE